MRKKHKIYQSPTVKIEPIPKAFVASVSVSNLQEQKTRFLKHGKTPIFVVEGDTATVEELATKVGGKIRFDLLGEAEHILHCVKQQYGKGENYLEHIYGPRIEQKEANEILFDYIRENSLQESLAVYWSNDMPCSARMTWKGYSFKCNKPEARRYALWLNGTRENPYLRRHGLRCLLDHEIGTHFYRSYNDGFQPWFYDRKKFGLRGIGSFESLCTEEGLASVNTTLRAREKYLWLSALTYYTACKSTEMTFKQLFDHLGQFVDNPEQRWKHVMRVKRGLVDPNDLGGYGKDQCYFEGAVTILRNIDDINFNLLMSGKICYDEVARVKRVARLGSVCLPAIMRDINSYRKQLRKMAVINGLHLSHPMHEPPKAYVQRLRERQTGARRRRKVRKNKKLRSSPSKISGLQTVESSFHSAKEQPAKSNSKAAIDTESNQKESGAKDQDLSSEGQDACVSVRDSPSGTPALESSGSTLDPGSASARHVCCPSAEDALTSPEVSGVKSVPDAWVYAQDRCRQVQAPVFRKPRPHTAAAELSTTSRLPPLQPCQSKDMNGNCQDAVFYLQSEGGDCSVLYGGGLCRLCGEDSSSSEDLGQSEEEGGGSWLPALPRSSPAPSSRQGHTPHLPPIIGQDGRSGSKVSADRASVTPAADSWV